LITVKKPSSPAEIRQSARHVLFVEGSDQDAIDPMALSYLLEEQIRVEPLGASYHIRSAAEGLYKYHPDYYFLIDRDHYDDEYVNKCWNNFPDTETPNLIIWHRREIENYFLIPEYITKSKFISASHEQIFATIIRLCNERLYLDTANHVIISIREDLKRNWIQLFTNPLEFKNKESAFTRLTEAGEFLSHKKVVSKTVHKKEIIKRFEKVLADMTGGKDAIEHGYGKWIEMIRGKKVLSSIVGNCFQVKDTRGTTLQGKEKLNEIVKELLKSHYQNNLMISRIYIN
jgi:hypothetical protein